MWAVAELQAQCNELTFGLRSVGTAAASGTGAVISITTLEDQAVSVSMDDSGVRCSGSDAPLTQVFDSVNSLFLNASPGFKAAFNASLIAKLTEVARAQQQDSDVSDEQPQ